MRGKACDGIQFSAIDLDHGNFLFECLRDQHDDRALALTTLNEQLVNGALAVQQLANGIASDDDATALLIVRRYACILLRLRSTIDMIIFG
jgi:hypothetical protein